MSIETRTNEILAKLTSCSKPLYSKAELLPEMLNLQKEMLEITFNKEHAELANLRLWDIDNHLAKLNEDNGSIATEELGKYLRQSKKVCNLIKAEISGNRGEEKAFKVLNYLHIPHYVLRNIVLDNENGRTEIDAVVITPFGITIVEVKNTSRAVFINEQGDFYRTGDYLHWDCNIERKMKLRETILRGALAKNGCGDTDIQSVIVFTNPKIEIQNKNTHIKVCFPGQLTHYIEDVIADKISTEDEMKAMASQITASSKRSDFPLDFDAAEFKKDFATVTAILENAAVENGFEKTKEVSATEDFNKECRGQSRKESRWKKAFPWMVGAVGAGALAGIGVLVKKSIKKK